ncbi:MAG: hypothetical protein O9275_20080, partial [Microcystis sp. LE19-196.1B]|nr:hypothetical protein [Microcystis sp. LE19-196.1B]
SLSISGLPSGVTVSGLPAGNVSVGGSGYSGTFSLNVPDDLPAGTYSFSFLADGPGSGSGSDNAEGTGELVISKASTTTVVTINGGPFTHTGSAITPATVTITGAGGLSLTPVASYADNINAGTATASYSYAGNDNYLPSSDSKNFTINKAPTVTTVTINGGPFTYIGSAIEPATVTVTGAGGLSLSPSANYSNNVNAGTATASYSYSESPNHLGSSDSKTFEIGKANATIDVQGKTVTYDGTAHGATGTAKGVMGDDLAGLDLGASFTNVPGGTANWTFTDVAGNYNNASGSVAIKINKAPTVTTVTINGGPFTYTGSAITPATVSVTGAGGLNLTT